MAQQRNPGCHRSCRSALFLCSALRWSILIGKPKKIRPGFNYTFNALSNSSGPNELSKALSFVFKSDSRMALSPILRVIFPIMRTSVRPQIQSMNESFSFFLAMGCP